MEKTASGSGVEKKGKLVCKSRWGEFGLVMSPLSVPQSQILVLLEEHCGGGLRLGFCGNSRK